MYNVLHSSVKKQTRRHAKYASQAEAQSVET